MADGRIMPDASIIITVVILVITVALFIQSRLRIDLIAICALVALLITGVLTPQQALTGFANQATATIAAMFVVSAGLVRTGLIQWVARYLDRLTGRTETRLILVICIVVAVLSAFLVNTAVAFICSSTSRRVFSGARLRSASSFQCGRDSGKPPFV